MYVNRKRACSGMTIRISIDIPVRTLECCSGDLADLKVKSVDVEAWSLRVRRNI